MTQVLTQTPRLRVIRLDVEAAQSALKDRERFARLVNADVHPDWPLQDMREILEFVHTKLATNSEAHAWVGVIIALAGSLGEGTPEADLTLGDIGFHASPVDGEVEVGYSIVPSYRGRGLATEALRAFLAWGFQHPSIEEVIGRCEVENVASRRVMEKSGFHLINVNDGFMRFRRTR